MKALSDALAVDHEGAVEQTAAVLQLGPGLDVRGGISTVARLIIEHAGASTRIRHISTMEDGTRWRKLGVFLHALATFMRALRSDDRLVVHIHFSSRASTIRKVFLAWLTLRARRPLILHGHSGSFDEYFLGLPSFAKRIVRSVFVRADCFIVLSTQWRDFYTRECGVSPERVLILHNPTTLPRETPDRSNRARVQFLFLGRLSQRKGIFDLLDAYASLPPEARRKARMVLAGDWGVEEVRARARQIEGDIEVHAWVDHATRDAMLVDSDVVVLPSYQEGVPMSILEGMAYGLPVITTPVGGVPDVVADEVEGLLIQPGDIPALRDAMLKMIEDEPQRLAYGREARKRAETFDVSRFSAELNRVYRRLLRRT